MIMDEISHFESRSGRITCSDKHAFAFASDIRNFEQFIPGNTITDWQADRESCSFSVSMLGTVKIRLTEKELYKKVCFSGDALKKNDFLLVLNISGNNINTADVKISLDAQLNPVLKMMAAKPIDGFLEMLISGMEKFGGWLETKE
jgi:hypothetical protein